MIQNQRSVKEAAAVLLHEPLLLITALPCLRLLTPNKNPKRIINKTGYRDYYILVSPYYLLLLILMCWDLAFQFWKPPPGNYTDYYL